MVSTVVRATAALAMRTNPPQKEVVDAAVAAGNFTTLARALEVVGLIDTFTGPVSFTVFASTDEAIGKLPAGTAAGLLKKLAKLKNILLYHVVAGRVTASDVVRLK